MSVDRQHIFDQVFALPLNDQRALCFMLHQHYYPDDEVVRENGYTADDLEYFDPQTQIKNFTMFLGEEGIVAVIDGKQIFVYPASNKVDEYEEADFTLINAWLRKRKLSKVL